MAKTKKPVKKEQNQEQDELFEPDSAGRMGWYYAILRTLDHLACQAPLATLEDLEGFFEAIIEFARSRGYESIEEARIGAQSEFEQAQFAYNAEQAKFNRAIKRVKKGKVVN